MAGTVKNGRRKAGTRKRLMVLYKGTMLSVALDSFAIYSATVLE